MAPADSPEMGFGTCEVTGQVVPRDALVDFQGKRVSAEGKQILLDRLQSGIDPIHDGPAVLPGPWRRAGCICIDNFALMAAGYILGATLGHIAAANIVKHHESAAQTKHLTLILLATISLCGWLLNVAYFTFMPFKSGKTLGKLVGREKIIRMDGGKMTFGQSLLRAIVFCLGSLFITCALFVGGLNSIALGELLGLAWLILDWAFIVGDPALRLALHDRIAGTRVIFSDGRTR